MCVYDPLKEMQQTRHVKVDTLMGYDLARTISTGTLARISSSYFASSSMLMISSARVNLNA